jgi:hypothetical protein
MSNSITIFKNDTITLCQRKDGFWLWDNTRGMNLSMRAKTEQDAFIETLMYYQKRLKEVETDYNILNDKVERFVDNFNEN